MERKSKTNRANLSALVHSTLRNMDINPTSDQINQFCNDVETLLEDVHDDTINKLLNAVTRIEIPKKDIFLNLMRIDNRLTDAIAVHLFSETSDLFKNDVRLVMFEAYKEAFTRSIYEFEFSKRQSEIQKEAHDFAEKKSKEAFSKISIESKKITDKIKEQQKEVENKYKTLTEVSEKLNTEIKEIQEKV